MSPSKLFTQYTSNWILQGVSDSRFTVVLPLSISTSQRWDEEEKSIHSLAFPTHVTHEGAIACSYQLKFQEFSKLQHQNKRKDTKCCIFFNNRIDRYICFYFKLQVVMHAQKKCQYKNWHLQKVAFLHLVDQVLKKSWR